MANEDEGARLTRREENRELIAKHRVEMGTIPDAERKKVMDAHLAATVEPKGCPTPGSCSAVAELADLKQRLLPQFQGRAQRAEHERDAMLEQLIAARSATAAPDRPDWARQLPGAELYDRDHGYNRSASLAEGRYVCTCAAGKVLHEKNCALKRRPDAQQPSHTTQEPSK